MCASVNFCLFKKFEIIVSKWSKICKITKESSYALKGDGTKLLDANGNPILISGRVDTKKLKEKYPHIWAECLVPTKSVEVRYEIKEVKNAK